MCSNHPQYFLSNQSRVTISSYAKIWYSEGGWSGVVTMPHIKAHGMVDLHPILIYTKSVQLWEAMDVLPSPSTPSIQSIKGYWAFVCKNMVFWGYWSGVVPSLPYPKANVMVNLHPLCTYNKFAQLQEAINVLPSPSTSSSPPQVRVTVPLYAKNMIFWGWLKWCGAIATPQRPWHGAFTSNIDLYQVCATPVGNECAPITLNAVLPIKQGLLSLGMQEYGILRVVEVVWCRWHTPRPMSWWIYVHYAPIPSPCNSGKQLMCSHHPQQRSSTQVRVTVAWFVNIWYFEGGWSGVVPLPYPEAHVMVDLYPLWTYTKSV
jgi:hypothetical protein